MEFRKVTKGFGYVGAGFGIIATANQVVVALSRECEANLTCLNQAMGLGLVAFGIMYTVGATAFIIRRLKK